MVFNTGSLNGLLGGRQGVRQGGGGGGRWYYPPLAVAMAEAGFEEIGTYVIRRHNMAAQYIATRPILDLCERSSRRTGSCVCRQWWDKDGLDLVGAKERAAA